MGADRAVHVKCGSEDIADLGPLAVSNIIAKVAQQEKVDLILLGKQVSPTSLWIIILLIVYGGIFLLLSLFSLHKNSFTFD